MEEEREGSQLRLEDALQPPLTPVVQGIDPVGKIRERFRNQEVAADAPAVLVRCSDGRWYAATQTELQAIFSELGDDPESPQAQISLEKRLGAERTPLVFPDQPLSSVFPHFRRWPVLPVSNRAVRGALEGVLSLDGVLQHYQRTGAVPEPVHS
jgi:CIC family chloride channel protein